jgi:MarR family transcriptional regulator, organic hydroperoxide resistance regulator
MIKSQSTSATGLPPLGDALEFMRVVWAVDHALQRRSKRMAATIGVTGPQRLVVRIVGRFPTISASQLSQILELHPSTVTCIVKGLERRQLITRTVDPRDSRRILLGLTAEGQAVNLAQEATIEQAVERALEDVPREAVQDARRLLARLAHELSPPPACRRSRPKPRREPV